MAGDGSDAIFCACCTSESVGLLSIRSSADRPASVIAADPPQRLAVLVVGPYRNSAMYRDRCDEWVLRAFGTAWMFDRVMLAVPE